MPTARACALALHDADTCQQLVLTLVLAVLVHTRATSCCLMPTYQQLVIALVLAALVRAHAALALHDVYT